MDSILRTRFGIHISLLLLLTRSCATGNRRVIDRFPNSRLPTPTRCLIGIVGIGDIAAHADTAANRRMLEEEVTDLIDGFKRINCTLIRLPATSPGHMDANDTYDGVAGNVQRNEIDIPFFFYRTDFFPIVIGHMGTQGMPADVTIISRKYDPYTQTLPLMKLWASSFDILTVTYVMISVILFTSVFTLTEDLLVVKSRTRLLKRLLKTTYINIFKVFFSFVDQENFEASSISGRIIVWFFNLFLFFFVHGFVFGSMGADLVALIDPPVINSMYEFTNTSQTQPVIIRQLFLIPLLKKAQPGTDLWHLNSVLKSKNDSNIFSFDISQSFTKVQQSLTDLLEEVMRLLKALVIPDLIWSIGKPLLCETQPSLARKIRHSSNLFFPGVFTSIMSLKIDPHLRQYWNYFVGTLCETRILSGTLLHVLRKLMPMTGQTYTGRSCENVPQKDQSISPFDWQTFKPIVQTHAILVLASAVILLIEKHNKNHYLLIHILFPRFSFFAEEVFAFLYKPLL